jgi:hypothetical protein
MVLLTKQQILAALDLPTEDVNVPEWGGVVRVRGLTGADRDAFEASVMTGRGRDREVNLRNLRAKLVAMSLVDERGNRLFTDDEAIALGAKSAVALERVFAVAQRLSGLTAADVDELSKNSDGGQSDASTSA